MVCFYRLEKLIELFKTIGIYSALGLSHIEGIDQLNSRFNLSLSSLKKKPYDVLDQRKTDFDNDYEDFKRQLSELIVRHFVINNPLINCFVFITIKIQLLQLLDNSFKHSSTTLQSINVAKRFMR